MPQGYNNPLLNTPEKEEELRALLSTPPADNVVPQAPLPEEELIAPIDTPVDLPIGATEDYMDAAPVPEESLEIPVEPVDDGAISEEAALRDRLGKKQALDILLRGASGGTEYGLADQAKSDLESHLKSKLLAKKAPKYVTGDNRPIFFEGGEGFVIEDGKKVPYEGEMYIPKQKYNKQAALDKAKLKGTKLSPAEDRAAKNTGGTLGDWATHGSKNNKAFINSLEEMVTAMAGPEGLSEGGLSSWAAGTAASLPLGVGRFLAPDTTSIKTLMNKLVQSDLRQTLGAQFTQKEGEDLLKRSFDPHATRDENLKMAIRMLETARYNGEEMERLRAHISAGKPVLEYVAEPVPDIVAATMRQIKELTGKDVLTPHQEALGGGKVSEGRPVKSKKARLIKLRERKAAQARGE